MSKIIVSENNPAYDTNPPYVPYLWTNSVTGELFVCIDNKKDTNIWQGQAGTIIGV
jgi:hypothetical protein